MKRLLLKRCYNYRGIVKASNDIDDDNDDAREHSKAHQESSQLSHQEKRDNSKDNGDNDKTRAAAATVKVTMNDN